MTTPKPSRATAASTDTVEGTPGAGLMDTVTVEKNTLRQCGPTQVKGPALGNGRTGIEALI